MYQNDQLLLMTDAYQMTMIKSMMNSDLWNATASFDVFFRNNPWNGGYSIFCGISTIADYLANHFKMSSHTVEYLQSIGYSNKLIANLSYLVNNIKSLVKIYSFQEGDVIFPKEPILRIEGPLPLLLLLETPILNSINHESLIATKATRITNINTDYRRQFMEFGTRRAHGYDAAIEGAKAAFIGGFFATSNMYAGAKYDIPAVGTCSHAWVMAHDSELEAFRHFAQENPNNCILIIDTYNVLDSGIKNAIIVFNEMLAAGKFSPQSKFGVRIDSGDLAYLSTMCRSALDMAGFEHAIIVASNDLDEYIINSLEKEQFSEIDMYGIGTSLITAKGNSSFGAVYKLSSLTVGNNTRNTMKISDNIEKMTLPGIKNVIRIEQGMNMVADLIILDEEKEMFLDNKRDLEIFDENNTNKKTKFQAENYQTRLMLNEYKWQDFDISKYNIYDAQENRKEEIRKLWEGYTRFYNPSKYKVDLSNKLYELKNKIYLEHTKEGLI